MVQQTAEYILPHLTLYEDGRLYNHKTKKFKKWTTDPVLISNGIEIYKQLLIHSPNNVH
jgi:hypothetical protein